MIGFEGGFHGRTLLALHATLLGNSEPTIALEIADSGTATEGVSEVGNGLVP